MSFVGHPTADEIIARRDPAPPPEPLRAHELLDRRNKVLHDARQLVDTAESENRDLAAEEQGRYDEMLAEVTSLNRRMGRRRQMDDFHAELSQHEERITEPDPIASLDELTGRSSDAVLDALAELFPKADLNRDWDTVETLLATDEYRDTYWKRLLRPSEVTYQEAQILQRPMAAVRSDSDVEGGFLTAPLQFTSGLLKALDAARPFRQWARVLPVRQADKLGIRKRTQKARSYRRGSEIHMPDPDASLRYGMRELEPMHYSAAALISRDTIRRAVLSVERLVIEDLQLDIGEGQEQEWITGSGADEALGIMFPSEQGISIARDVFLGNTQTEIQFDGLMEAKYAVLRYWPNARWVFHPDGQKKIALIKNLNGDYIWRESTRVGEPDRLLGIPVFLHEFMPNTFTPGSYVGILGDFVYYIIAEALQTEMQRLVELYSKQNLIGFHFRGKNDGAPILEEGFAHCQRPATLPPTSSSSRARSPAPLPPGRAHQRRRHGGLGGHRRPSRNLVRLGSEPNSSSRRPFSVFLLLARGT